jgi:hypothetical protein
MGPQAFLLLVKVIDGALFAMEHAPKMLAAWRGHLGLIRTLINEDREPTPAEWQSVDDTAQAQADALRAVVEGDENGG